MEALRQKVGADVLRPTVRAGKRVLQAAQHAGVLRLRNRTIQILPKIYLSSDKEPNNLAQEASANLLLMLSYAERLPIREIS
ncbi:MAG: hypothetical protein IT210_24715, partial [Armatimonadetes bacterium]|nr:hypothetical protein [Armatimonadota bacterium]